MSRDQSDQRSSDQRTDVSRRDFLETGSWALGSAAIGGVAAMGFATSNEVNAAEPAPLSASDDLGPIPRKTLGRTGEKVSIMGLGTSPIGRGPQTIEECVSVFSEAIDRGINYIDTARRYKKSEEALGRVLKTRRDKVFLVTKCLSDTRKEAQESFETSLRHLGVDHVDLLHLHSTGNRDIDVVLGEGGAWEYFLEMKKQGKARFLGITGHSRPQLFLRMLATDQVDVMMVAMNFIDRYIYGFEEKVVPTAIEHKTGIMAMKVFGGPRGGFDRTKVRLPSQLDPIHLQIAVRYALGLEGVTGVVLGVQSQEELRQDIRYVLNAPPLSEKENEALDRHGKRLANSWGPRFGPIS